MPGREVVLGLLGRDRQRLEATARACEGEGSDGERCRDRRDRGLRHGVMAAPVRSSAPGGSVDRECRHLGRARPRQPFRRRSQAVARQIAVNLLGAINTVEPLLPAMCARGRGRIAVVSSIAAYRGLPYSPGYCASKAGLRAYAEALRPRLERHGVGMTVVCPGFFDSPMTDRFDGPTPFLLSSERAARIVKRGIDRGRRRVAFPWPLVLGLQFCDFAPAAHRRCDPAPLPFPDPFGDAR